MSRVLAFFLGMIFGIIFLIGGLAAGVYIAYTMVKPTTIDSNASNYLGDLADLSIKQIVDEVISLYNAKAGIADPKTGEYFSLGDFMTYYNINLSAVLGMNLPDEILTIPVFEFVQEGGIDITLKQLKVSSIPAVVNMFADENGAIAPEVLQELDKYSMADLIAEDKGITYVLQNIKFADILPTGFPTAGSDNMLMWAVGQSKIGKLLDALGSNDSLFVQLKPGGALEALGGVKMTELLGGSTGILGALLAEGTVADLIDENGAVNVDGLLDSLYLGSLLGCMRAEISDTSEYTRLDGISTTEVTVWKLGTSYAMTSGDTTYAAAVTCDNEDEAHSHTLDCFSYIWYSQTALGAGHEHHENELVINNEHHAEATGINKLLANIMISDFMEGSTDFIMQKIQKIKLGELLGNNLSGIMTSFADMSLADLMGGGIDKLYLGAFLEFTRTAGTAPEDITILGNNVAFVGYNEGQLVMSDNKLLWFNAKLTCTEAHTHTRDCYSYIWYNNGVEATGMMAKLADKKVGELSTLDSIVQELSLRDVLGESGVSDGIFASIADVPVGNLSQEINKLYLGNVLGCMRAEVQIDGYTQMAISTSTISLWQKGDEIAKKDGEKYYKADITCTLDHTHTASCYNYLWYNQAVLGSSHTHHDTELVVGDKHHALIKGIYKALVNLKLEELTNGSSDAIIHEIQHLTLAELMGDGQMSGIMANFSDMTINELMNGGLEDLYLGSFFKYDRVDATAPASSTALLKGGQAVAYVGNVSGQIVMSDDQKAWYKAQLVCTETHTHNRDCYSYIWMNGNATATGMMAKLSDKKISEMSSLDSIIQSFTLRDVLGNNLSGMLLELADVPVNQISDKINTLYLGSAMSYYRKKVTSLTGYTAVAGCTAVKSNGTSLAKSDDGEAWFEAYLDCLDTTHAHTDSCYAYVWYVDANCTTEITGVTKAFANSTLDNVSSAMDNLTLRKLGIVGNNNILKSMQDVPIMEIGERIDEMKLGTVLGYHQVTAGGLWYDQDDTEVKGLNAKISDRTIAQLGSQGITDIVVSLTIGDLIDSGMMAVSASDEYKLDIIYDGSGQCTLRGYFTYLAMNPSATARDYYISKHGSDETYRGAWKDLELSDFISTLLGSF